MRLNFAMLSDPMQKPTGQDGTEGTTSAGKACSRPILSGDKGDGVGQSPLPITGTQTDRPELPHLSHQRQTEVGRGKPSIDAAVPHVPFVPPKKSIDDTAEETIEKRSAIRVADGCPTRDQEGVVTSHPHETQATIVEFPDTVAVAPLTLDEESAIRTWLAHIGEADPATITELLDKSQQDMAARNNFIAQAKALPKPVDAIPDDRRTCNQCENLIDGDCYGDMVALRGYVPNCDQPRRCEGYMPGENDSDRRVGWERWPGLSRKWGDEAAN